MRYYSDKTSRVYKTKEECEAAEKAYDEKKAEKTAKENERRAARKEIDRLYDAYIAAVVEYNKKYEDNSFFFW